MHPSKTKTLLLAIPMLASFSAFAQIEKGTMFIGGRINFNRTSGELDIPTQRSEKSTLLNIGLNPRAGYFISNSFALGIGLDYQNSYTNNNTVDAFNNSSSRVKSWNNRIGLNVFGRYTKPVGKKFFLFLDGNIATGFGFNKSNQTSNMGGVITYAEYKTKGLEFGNYVSLLIRPGIIYFISPKFGLETSYGSLGYTYNKVDAGPVSGSQKSSDLGLNLGTSSLMLGVNYYFKCKPKPVVSQEEQD